MSELFSEELQSAYRNILLQQQKFSYANMLSSFLNATASSQESSPSSSSAQSPSAGFYLDVDIPKDEIEGDIEVIMTKSFQDTLQKLNCSMNGFRGKKFGFREVIDLVQSRPCYKSGNTMLFNLKRATSITSSGSMDSPREVIAACPLTPTSSTKGESRKRKREDDHDDALNDSSASSNDGRLEIDLDEKPSECQSISNGESSEPLDMSSTTSSKDTDDENEKNPLKLRIERMKTIHKGKPKLSLDNVDLTYHSNMARSFPGTEQRSLGQQERRSRNTLAARISRNKTKAYEKMLESMALETTQKNINLKRKIACLRVYTNSLLKLSGIPDKDFGKLWEENIRSISSETADDEKE